MSFTKRLAGVLLATALLALLGAAGADAAQRFVATTGSGSACTQAAACSISTGIGSAGFGDEVIVAAGTYSPPASLQATSGGIYIHGASPGARPVINGAAGVMALSMNGANDRVADLTINSNFTGLYLTGGAVMGDRVDVHSTGQFACEVGSGGQFRDSLCVDSATSGTAFLLTVAGNASATLRNITAIASGGGNSVAVQATETNQTLTVDARNILAVGLGRDVVARATNAAGSSTVNLQNSNFATVNGTGPGTTFVTPVGSPTNQSGMPLFTDAVSYHEAPGSPTIDAGAVDAATGTADLDGQARVQGPAIDIGADEAPDLTPPEGAITSHPKPKTKAKVATFEFSSSEAGSTFTCQIDKKAAAPCTSPLTIKHVKKGRHRLTLTTTDPAGNVDPSPETFKWKVSKRHNVRHHHGHHH